MGNIVAVVVLLIIVISITFQIFSLDNDSASTRWKQFKLTMGMENLEDVVSEILAYGKPCRLRYVNRYRYNIDMYFDIRNENDLFSSIVRIYMLDIPGLIPPKDNDINIFTYSDDELKKQEIMEVIENGKYNVHMIKNTNIDMDGKPYTFIHTIDDFLNM